MQKNNISNFFIEIYNIVSFSFRFLKELFLPPYEFNEVCIQSYNIATQSLPLVGLTSFTIGIVLVLQSRPALVEFGAGSYIPAMAAVSIIREIGPMITGMICAGNIGSSMSAEIGSMKVTEQIDAMEVSGIKPFKYLVVTRVIGTTIIIPMLVIYSDLVSLVGSYIGANLKDEISFTLFFEEVFEKLKFKDIAPSIIKTFFFGFSIGIIGCYKGYFTAKGTEGVGKSTNSAVIISMVFVILIDAVAAQVSSIFHLL